MNAIFDQATRIQEEVPEVGTAAGEDVTEHWFRQKDPRSLRVGRKADYPQSRGGGHSFNSWEFLHHYEGPKELPGPVHPPFEQGLRLTRFKKGMYRRNYRDICQDKERLEKEARKEVTRQEHAERRRHFLEQQDKKNGFNVVSGAQIIPHQWKPSIRHLSGELSHNLAREGLIRLRDSSDRFYIPHYSGPQHDHRQRVMFTQGLLKPPMSAVIGIGKSQLSSFGVEDQFSHADYAPKEACKVPGLYESTQPGVFTPAKFPKKIAQYLYPLHKRPDSGSSLKYRPLTALAAPVSSRKGSAEHQQDIEAVRSLPAL